MSRSIINLSSIPPSREMRRRGVFELPTTLRFELQQLLTFEMSEVIASELHGRAQRLASLAEYVGASRALVDVPGFMIAALEAQLIERDIIPMYAWGFVKRYEVETEHSDIPTVKCKFIVTSIFDSPEYTVLAKSRNAP